MQFFNSYFKLGEQETSLQGEYTVLCPFDHKDSKGNSYKETNASAHINRENSVFHCKSCGKGISEVAFISKIEGISYKDSITFIQTLEDSPNSDWTLMHNNLLANKQEIARLKEMGLEQAVKDVRLGYSGTGIDIPVFVYGELLDVRNYVHDRKPRVMSQTGAKNLIIPFDLWREDERPTLLCAGEKDMMIARENGFNAITFTGGEMSFPKLFKHSFKGRKVYICYDNDPTGHKGAINSAYHLTEAGAEAQIVTGHHAVCTEKGGDIHDFFMKYNKTSTDLQTILDSAQEVTPEQIESIKNEVYPLIPIEYSSQGMYVDKRLVRSRIDVVSIYEEMYSIPEFVRFTKMDKTEDCFMEKGEVVEWILEDVNLGDILYIMDAKITKDQRNMAIRRLAGIYKDEKFIQMQILSSTNVWKAIVSDTMETETEASELLMFSIGERFVAGKKYELLYKPTAHPLEGMKVVGICKAMKDNDIEIENFKVTNETRELLKVFQLQEGETVDDKMYEFYERTKDFVGVEARKDISWATDLFYHTPLEFKFGKRVERAYLDLMIVGDSRTMKSATAKAMQEMYGLGTVISLKTATIAGLIGGSSSSGGSGWKTKIGLLPRSHKGAVIMEEFSGGGREIISKLTEVRSSNRARILRLDGHLDVPAMVRMLSISNVTTPSGNTVPVRAYPSGVPIIQDLIGASEDIARYDFFVIVAEADGYTSPLDMFELEAFEQEAYRSRIQWVWSRQADHVVLDRPIMQHIVTCAEELNRNYDFHIKLFGPEAWKKLARISIAVAGMLVSTDEDYANIVVKKEHVNFAFRFMKDLYDNDVFRLKPYVDNERSYSVCRDVDIAALQEQYLNNETLMDTLANATDVSQRQLQLSSGLAGPEFTVIVSNLERSRFIQFQKERIVPTNKFRIAYGQITKKMYLEQGSERN